MICLDCGAFKGELGLEPAFELYVEHIVEVFRAVKRVLRDDGTLWLNLGDAYSGSGKGQMGDGRHSSEHGTKQGTSRGTLVGGLPVTRSTRVADQQKAQAVNFDGLRPRTVALQASSRLPSTNGADVGGWTDRNESLRMGDPVGLGAKQLIGIPWRIAFALQRDGWVLRNDIIWQKPNPMPGSQQDRFTTSYEHVFLFAKSPRYYFDLEAVKEPAVDKKGPGNKAAKDNHQPGSRLQSVTGFPAGPVELRTPRDVWTFPTAPYKGAHFATYPPRLVETCLKAGTSGYGCCADCGASYRRVVQTTYENPGNRQTNGPRSLANRDQTAGFPVRLEKVTKTVGWEKSCKCATDVIVPCTILDPFGGSGTTAVAALSHGRSSILVELKKDYVSMAERRIKQAHETASIKTIQAQSPAHQERREGESEAGDTRQEPEVLRRPVADFDPFLANIDLHACLDETPCIHARAAGFDTEFFERKETVRRALEENPQLVVELDIAPRRNNAVRQNWSQKSAERLTPQKFLKDVVAFFGGIELDPSAEDTVGGQFNVPADLHYTKDVDGLRRPWGGSKAYVNPPYDDLKRFAAKALATLQENEETRILLLTPARPGRGWWHDLSGFPVLLLESRLHFGMDDSAPFPSALFYLHSSGPEETARFAQAFAKWGSVWHRIPA